MAFLRTGQGNRATMHVEFVERQKTAGQPGRPFRTGFSIDVEKL